jgi:PAS domain S-box-containing protein
LAQEMMAVRDVAADALQAIIDAVPDSVAVFDRELHLVRSNAAHRAALESFYAQEPPTEYQERVQATETIFFDATGARAPQAQWPPHRILRGETLSGPTAMEAWSTTRQGETWWRFTGAPLRTDDGAITGAVVVATDITARKRAEAEVRRANERFRLAERAANGFVYEWTLHDGIHYRSAGFERLLGYRREELAPSWAAWAQLVYPGDWQVSTDEEEMAYLDALPGETLENEYRVRHRDGHYLYVAEHSLIERDAAGHVARLIGQIQDITDRKQEERRQEFLLKLSDTLRTLTDPVAIQTSATTLLREHFDVARSYYTEIDDARDVAYIRAESVRDGTAPSVTGVYNLRDFEQAMAILRDGAPLVIQDWRDRPFQISDVGGDELLTRQIRAQITVPLIKHGALVGSLAVNDTRPHTWTEQDVELVTETAERAWGAAERAAAEAEVRHARDELEQRVTDRTRELDSANTDLRRLSHRVLETQESERRLIARELHDEIGQQLTGVKMLLETLEESVKDGSGFAATTQGDVTLDKSLYAPSLSEISVAVATVLERVRDLSLDLRPAVLDSLGLIPALQWQFERYAHLTGVHVDFSVEGLDHRLPARLEAGVYRLIQEALTNVSRHAGVSQVTVQIYVTEVTLSLYVVDAGIGFDVEKALATGGSTGLSGMRERADLLGGTLNIDSLPGEGTTVHADLSVVRAIEMEAAHETEQESAYVRWQTPEDDAARHRARDELRDRARDKWRDAARDARRDSLRDALRDMTHVAARDATKDAPRERQERQEPEEREEGQP